MPTRHHRLALLPLVALVLAACANTNAQVPASPTPQTSENPPVTAAPTSTPDGGFSVSSEDFAHGDELEDWATASAFSGQCTGENLNPHLEWTAAPDGTESFAITMLDASAGNFVHWVHINIPADVTSVARGEAASLPGVTGRHGASGEGYFGPCPPNPGHRYIFTIWALDTMLEDDAASAYYTFFAATEGHVLAKTEITGMR